MSGMLTMKASLAAVILAGASVLSAGAGYAISRVSMTAAVAVTCPTAAKELPWSLPSGPVPQFGSGKKF